MALLSDADMSRLSTWIERAVLKDRGVIWRNHPSRSASGGQVDHWQQEQTDVPCAVLSRSDLPQERPVAGQTEGSVTKLVLLPRGTALQGDDRFEAQDVVYHVLDLYEPSTYEVCRRVVVRRSSIPGGR